MAIKKLSKTLVAASAFALLASAPVEVYSESSSQTLLAQGTMGTPTPGTTPNARGTSGSGEAGGAIDNSGTTQTNTKRKKGTRKRNRNTNTEMNSPTDNTGTGGDNTGTGTGSGGGNR